jgi:hypothetical protein
MPIRKKNVTNVGREREVNQSVNFVLNSKKKRFEEWGFKGAKDRYKVVFELQLKKKPIKYLLSNNIKNPEIMMLGPSSGEYILEFKKQLVKNKINPVIDCFSLKNELKTNIEQEVRLNIFGEGAFEKLNTKTNNTVLKKIQKSLINKYDLIIGAMSVGVHTKYPINALFTSALMLKKGGKAYIEIPVKDENYLKSMKSMQRHLLTRSQKELLYSKLQSTKVEEFFNRFVNSYNPKLKFKLKEIQSLYHEHYTFIEITRIQ